MPYVNGRRIHPNDASSDLATMNAPAEVVVAPPEKPKGKPAWARKTAPRSGKDAVKFVRAVLEGHPDGETFYYPLLGLNVVKNNGVLELVEADGPVDEKAWYAAGCYGPAPVETVKKNG